MSQQVTNDLCFGNIKINNITQRRVAILGGPGTGKTSTLKIMCLRCPPNIKLYVFDPLEVIPEMPGFYKINVSKKEIEKGAEFGKFLNTMKIGKDKKGVIISYKKLLQKEQNDFTNSLFGAWNPKDCLIAFDEIHEFTPEMGMKMEYGSETERSIRHWRNQNCGFILTSQRPSFVSKRVLGLADYLILYRLTYHADVKAIKEELKMNKAMADKVVSEIQYKDFLEGYAIDFRYQEFNK
jgi:DNA helicase HerA-like ATPase